MKQQLAVQKEYQEKIGDEETVAFHAAMLNKIYQAHEGKGQAEDPDEDDDHDEDEDQSE